MSKKNITIDPNLGNAGAGGDDSVQPSVLRSTLQDIVDNQNRLALLQGWQKAVAANGAANTAVAKNTVGIVLVDGDLAPFVAPEGAATAGNTDYATLTFTLERGGQVINTWTMTTKLASVAGGTGDWADGALFQPTTTYAAKKGDKVTVAEAKSGAGVQLPARWHGFTVV